MTNAASRAVIRQELERFCSFPAGHPTDAEVDLIVADIASHERRTGSAPGRHEVERFAALRVPGTRFIRLDGLNFQDINALLAAIKAQAAQTKK